MKRPLQPPARILQISFILGLGLAVVVGVGLRFGAGIFTSDIHVQHLIFVAISFVAGTQPINSLAFVFDRANFGASDLTYSVYSMDALSVVSIGLPFVLFKPGDSSESGLLLTNFMACGGWEQGLDLDAFSGKNLLPQFLYKL